MTANRMIFFLMQINKKIAPPEWRQTVWFFSWCPLMNGCIALFFSLKWNLQVDFGQKNIENHQKTSKNH